MTRIHKVSVVTARSPRALVAVAVAAFSLAACGDGGAQRPPQGVPEVSVETIAPHPIVAGTELSGRLSAIRVADVRPQVQGIVMKRLFTEGSMVAAGAVLYQIDPSSYQASYDQAVGTLVKAQATADAAQTKATRYTDLSKIDGVSKQDYDDAISSLQEAKADVVADRAALKTTAINLGYTKIVSPIAGRIGKSSVTEGALVTAEQTTALATVQATGEMYLDVTRSSVDWLRLQKEFASGQLQQAGSDGAVVHLVMEDGSEYPHAGKLLFSDITVDATTGSVTLRSVFPNPEGALLPGMFVRARLEEGVNQQAITVPQLAVSRASDGSASVLTVGADGKVVQTSVTANTANGANWVITSGLKAGDRVVVSGSQKARTGALVKAVESPSPSYTPATPATAASATRS
ncbi:efflux RND transporter periplasmic adaptor subunit [Caballeronia sp. SEWSISQ10-4 2]|uniref:efflux RND transporter periplasmic adaptor subunit n=1 Tax=Caballeronia sp. SEWSISQ10-4 2 TaxID=2937438 RepID=UPI0026510A77|nr:efflux RND transporter periplasmic adaptor subunit [Caballeronia sp. SEWSISQ10-4 2]MDN7180505.1 efflux RND transporter periplasmic adaptor subunit [Caballeronia sp. SEWSISQ10-4 2]